ncbi:MAG: hypothetical protein HZA63_03665 [Rhodocyclales bacterium]|nr:hypothetical protein [Rhodocyclales bacterium]
MSALLPILLFIASLATFPQPAFGEESASILVCCDGEVTIIDKDGLERKGKVGDKLNKGDTIKTGPDSRAEIRLPDGSRIGVGVKAQFELDDFVLKPGASRGDSWFIMAMKGIAWFLVPPPREMYPGEIEWIRLHGSGVHSTGAGGIRGSEYVVSAFDSPTGETIEISMLSGSMKLGTVDFARLPDRYFTDPFDKSFYTLDDSRVIAEMGPEMDYVDLLISGGTVEVGAGQWTRIVGLSAPNLPQPGLAPSHAGFDVSCIPEPQSYGMLIVGLVLLAFAPGRRRMNKA